MTDIFFGIQTYYKLGQHVLKIRVDFITNWGKYYKLGQVYYKLRQLLQIVVNIYKLGLNKFKQNRIRGRDRIFQDHLSSPLPFAILIMIPLILILSDIKAGHH